MIRFNSVLSFNPLKQLIWVISAFTLFTLSCTSSYLYQSRSGRMYISDDLHQFMLPQVQTKFNINENLNLIPIVAKKSDFSGLYGANKLGMHWGRVNFYVYADSVVTAMDRSNPDSLKKAVGTWMIQHHFDQKLIEMANERIDIVYSINRTDYF